MDVFRYLTVERKAIQHNVISPVMIFIICFVAIIPFSQSYTVRNHKLITNNHEFATNCITTITPNNAYNTVCTDVDVDDLTAVLENEVASFPNGQKRMDHLYIQNLLVKSGKLSKDWIKTTNFQIIELQLMSATINSIDAQAFVGFAFEKVEYLTLEDMKIDTLDESIFEGLSSLIELTITKCEINNINGNVLKAVAPHLKSLYLMHMVLPLNPKNLTSTVPLDNLKFLGLSFNNLGSLDAESFSQVLKPEVVFLHSAQIKSIACGTFKNMKSIKLLSLDSNLLTTLDACVFGDEVINSLGLNSLTISDNQWNCNCDLQWLKQLKIDNKIIGSAKCASHSNLPFEEVNFCSDY